MTYLIVIIIYEPGMKLLRRRFTESIYSNILIYYYLYVFEIYFIFYRNAGSLLKMAVARIRQSEYRQPEYRRHTERYSDYRFLENTVAK